MIHEQDIDELERQRVMAEYHRMQELVDVQERTCDLCHIPAESTDDIEACGQCGVYHCRWCAGDEPELCMACDEHS